MQVFAWDRQAENEARANFFRETLQNIRALPGVAAAGAISSFPLGLADITVETPFTIRDQPLPPPGEEPSTALSQVTPGYFDAMRIPFRDGRRFDERDDAERPGVAVINETLAPEGSRQVVRAGPLLDLGVLVRRIVVQHQVDVQLHRHLPVDQPQERERLGDEIDTR